MTAGPNINGVWIRINCVYTSYWDQRLLELASMTSHKIVEQPMSKKVSRIPIDSQVGRSRTGQASQGAKDFDQFNHGTVICPYGYCMKGKFTAALL